LIKLVRSKGLEPLTTWFEARCSIQLSYERIGEREYSATLAIIEAAAAFLLKLDTGRAQVRLFRRSKLAIGVFIASG
jgi:hypothetical protein